MTITLELTPEQEACLTLKARNQGKPLDVYLREAVNTLAMQAEVTKGERNEEKAVVDEWDTLGKLIDACQIDAGITKPILSE